MLKKELKLLLAQDETQEVIERLLSEAENAGDNEAHQELIILSAHFQKLEKGQLTGTSSDSEIRINSAKINQGLLKIIDRLPFQPSTVKPSPASSSKNVNWLAYIIPLAAALIFFIFKILPSSVDETSDLTIYVHGSGGKQDYVLVNEGKLIVDFGKTRQTVKVGENGRTVFSEIASKFKGQIIPISIKANGFEPAHPDREYIWDGEPIYFEVQPDLSVRQIKGIVKSQSDLVGIPNVKVTIDNEFFTETDSLGVYSYIMDANQVKERYDISFQKDGYEPHQNFYYPGKAADVRLKEK